MRILLVIFFIAFSSCIGSKSISPGTSKKTHEFVNFTTFEIRQKPILNREYISFLCWYIDVYGLSYPEKVFEILPENSLSYTPDCSDGFEPLFASIDQNALLKNYILNPEFLNYPLLGLSEYQVMELQNWLYDRYNESTLIRNNYLHYNSAQKDEDCFTTESLLVGQYAGNVQKEYSREWNENEFKFMFRLPYEDELVEVRKDNRFGNKLIAYPFNKKDFLWEWDQHYITKNDDGDTLLLKFFYAPIPITNFKRPEELLSQKFSDASLADREKEFVNAQYLQSESAEPYPYPEKEYDGRMKFVVVGANDRSKAITAERVKTDKQRKLENKVYRIVSNLKVDKKYWP